MYRKIYHGKIEDLGVYVMTCSDSLEEQAYLTTIRSEKVAFERLIHEKSVQMVYFDRFD